MSLLGCMSLCTTAPSQFVSAGEAGSAETPTLSPVIDTGVANSVRLQIAFLAAAGNSIVSIQWSDDGEEWFYCNVDLVAALGDTEGKQLISLCLDSPKRFLRIEFQTPNGYTINAELTGLREMPDPNCTNDETAECALSCDDVETPVPVEEGEAEEGKRA